MFVAKQDCLLVSSFSEYSSGFCRPTVRTVLYLWSKRVLAVGGETFVAVVLSLQWLNEKKKQSMSDWLFCTFQLVSAACGEEGLWSLQDYRHVFSLQVRMCTSLSLSQESVLEGEPCFRDMLYSCSGICQTAAVFTLTWWAPVTPFGHFTFTPPWLQTDSLPELLFEPCPVEKINNKVYFGSRETRALGTTAVLDKVLYPHCVSGELQELMLDFLQACLHPKSMPGTWFWLSGFEDVEINRTLQLASDWMFSFVLCASVQL